MEMDFVNTTSIVISFLALLFIVFLLTVKTERKLSNIFLALYLLFFIQDTCTQYTTQYLFPLSWTFGMLVSTTVLLIMPFLYLFFKAAVYRNFKVTGRSLVHVSGYVLVNIVLIPGYYILVIREAFTGEEQAAFDQSFTVLLIYILIYIQVVVYFTLIFLMLRKYKTILSENFSNPDMSNYQWLIQFFTVMVTLEIFGLARNIIRFTGSEKVFDIATFIITINMLFYVSWILIKSLKNPGIFMGVSSNTQLVKSLLKEEEAVGDQAEGARLKNEDLIRIEKIKTHMETEKPYLDASLSIYNLAIQVDMSVKDLSVLINHKLNQHFFDFVNRYRIEQAMEMLRDPDKANLTILEILYEVGFNSKSSFNTIFRKYTGTTPTEYRRSKVA